MSFAAISQHKKKNINPSGSVKITFENVTGIDPLVLNDSTYLTPFGEKYTISKFRYYVTNVSLSGPKLKHKEVNSYHLVDELKPSSQTFTLNVKPGKYTALSFLLGVDSIHNVSGAQIGALDPLNDMFWTWNSGYVNFKLEGHSLSSGLRENKFEYHIGGFTGMNNTTQKITLGFPLNDTISVVKGGALEIIVQADLLKWWKGSKDIRITEISSVGTPGPIAKAISENYARMFIIQQVTNPGFTRRRTP